MEKHFLELLLIAEKDKIDAYVEYAKKDGVFNKDDEKIGLCRAFVWKSTKEGFAFWNDIHTEAWRLSRE